MPTPQVTISTYAYKILLADIYKRRSIEACGLLTGSIDELGNWHIEKAHPLPNIFDSPVYFEFAPEDILAVEFEHPGQVVGAYHSHPTGLAVASRTDRENMKRVNLEQQIPWVWFIISGPFIKEVTSFYPLDKSGGHHQKERVPRPAIIAYHHFEEHGLQQVKIQLEEGLN
jgi:proteasome lid subunit RPN8/RPN11